MPNQLAKSMHEIAKQNRHPEREFPQILRELRKQRGLRIKDVSIATGISENALSYYETGKGYPTAPFICWLADYFGVTTDYLLGRDVIDH